MKILFQQDECVPDSLEFFHAQFLRAFGLRFEDWKETAQKTQYDDGVKYQTGQIVAEIYADDPYWTVSRIDEPDQEPDYDNAARDHEEDVRWAEQPTPYDP